MVSSEGGDGGEPLLNAGEGEDGLEGELGNLGLFWCTFPSSKLIISSFGEEGLGGILLGMGFITLGIGEGHGFVGGLSG